MLSPRRVLVLEHNPSDFHLLQDRLRRVLGNACEIRHELRLQTAIEYLWEKRVDVLFADLKVPDSTGRQAVLRLVRAAPNTPIIVTADPTDLNAASHTLTAGAQEYLSKASLDDETLTRAVRHAVERQQSQNQLSEANRRLARQESDLKLFSGCAAHDVRGPLVSIAGTCAVARKALRDHDTDRIGAALDSVERAAKRANQMVGGVIDLAAIGTARFERKRFRLDTMIKSVCSEFIPDAQERGADIVVQPSPQSAYGDPRWIRRVLYNLVENAVTHACVHGRHTVRVGAEVADHKLNVFVEDDGPGIPSDWRTKVFDPFAKLTTDYDSLGLGLALCQRVVAEHGGRIWVDSEIGVGCRFVFTLPIRTGADANPADANLTDGSPAVATSRSTIIEALPLAR